MLKRRHYISPVVCEERKSKTWEHSEMFLQFKVVQTLNHLWIHSTILFCCTCRPGLACNLEWKTDRRFHSPLSETPLRPQFANVCKLSLGLEYFRLLFFLFSNLTLTIVSNFLSLIILWCNICTQRS